MMDLLELIALVRTDLDQIEDAIRWAHADAYWPTNAQPRTTTRGFGPSNEEQGEPDQVPGPLHDFGIGSHRRRRALTDALHELDQLEKIWPASHLAGKQRTRRWAHLVLTQNRARLELIERFTPTDPRKARRTIEAAYACTDRACRRLNAAFAEGKAGDPNEYRVKVPMCIICRIRPRADKTGKRCHTCWTWKERNKFERPKSLDQEGIAGARQAAERRRDRGEGWGEA